MRLRHVLLFRQLCRLALALLRSVARRCAATSGCKGRISGGWPRGCSQSASRGFCQRSTVPSSLMIVRNFTPHEAIATIAAFAVLHSNHRQPAAIICKRTALCDAVHRPDGLFNSMPMGFARRHQINMSGRPHRQPLFLRNQPDIGDRATPSVAVKNASSGNHRVNSRASEVCCSHSHLRATELQPALCPSTSASPASPPPNKPVGRLSVCKRPAHSNTTVEDRTRCVILARSSRMQWTKNAMASGEACRARFLASRRVPAMPRPCRRWRSNARRHPSRAGPAAR